MSEIPYFVSAGSADDHENYIWTWPSFTLFTEQELFSGFQNVFTRENVTLNFINGLYNKNANSHIHTYFWEQPHFFYKDAIINAQKSKNIILLRLCFLKCGAASVFGELNLKDKKFYINGLNKNNPINKYQLEISNFLDYLLKYFLAKRYLRKGEEKYVRYKNNDQKFLIGACHN